MLPLHILIIVVVVNKQWVTPPRRQTTPFWFNPL
jgi:hypothetical protein